MNFNISSKMYPKGVDPKRIKMMCCVLAITHEDWEKLEKMAVIASEKVPSMTPERVIDVIIREAVQRWEPGQETAMQLNPS